MLTSAPECRVVCNGSPGKVMEELIFAFRVLRSQGISEEQVLLCSRDPDQVIRLLPSTSPGTVHGVAAALVSTGCAECAVNLAFTD